MCEHSFAVTQTGSQTYSQFQTHKKPYTEILIWKSGGITLNIIMEKKEEERSTLACTKK